MVATCGCVVPGRPKEKEGFGRVDREHEGLPPLLQRHPLRSTACSACQVKVTGRRCKSGATVILDCQPGPQASASSGCRAAQSSIALRGQMTRP